MRILAGVSAIALATAASAAPARAPRKPPAFVAGLFAARTFELPASTMWRTDHERHEGVVGCSTSEPHAFHGAWIVSLDCAPKDFDAGGEISDWVAWTIIATPRGVWLGSDPSVDPDDLDRPEMLLAAVPRPGRYTVAPRFAGSPDRWKRVVRRVRHAICVDEIDTRHPSWGESWCFDGTLVGAQYRNAESVITIGRMR